VTFIAVPKNTSLALFLKQRQNLPRQAPLIGYARHADGGFQDANTQAFDPAPQNAVFVVNDKPVQ
jgi:hypothetical protein